MSDARIDDRATLIDSIARAAVRAGWPLAAGRPEEIAAAVAPRLDAFAPARARLRIDDGPDFEAALHETRYRETGEAFAPRGNAAARGGSQRADFPTQLHEMSLLQAAAALQAGVVSSTELTRHALARAHRVQAVCNAFISIDDEGALQSAHEADRRRAPRVSDALARGPIPPQSTVSGLPDLLGVPIAYKDMFYRNGRIATCGSQHRREWVAGTTAYVVDRLRRAGVVELGTLNMTEFAYGPTGQNAYFGDARNPWHTDYLTGGSSSGSAVSVATRVAFGALGSDTAGSVRMPAALCGVTGMKTTHGLVSRYGCMPLSNALDTIGPLTRSVADNAAMLAWMTGFDPRDPASRSDGTTLQSGISPHLSDINGKGDTPLAGLRIGLPRGYFDRGIAADIARCLAAAANVFTDLGATLVSVDMPDLDAINAAGVIMTWGDVLGLHGHMMRTAASLYSAQTRGRIEVALGVSAEDVIDAHRYRGVALREFAQQVFSRCDIVLAPTFALTVARISDVDVRGGPAMLHTLDEITRLTRPANVLGLPALAMPAGFSGNGMPVGMQLMGRPFAEVQLYRAGHAYQQMCDWHSRIPPLSV